MRFPFWFCNAIGLSGMPDESEMQVKQNFLLLLLFEYLLLLFALKCQARCQLFCDVA